MLISACLIVRNEAPVLPRALASLAGRADEIVVVDTGSTDGTQDLCRGVVLSEVPWEGSFSAARNAALARARGRFCLMVDADEEVDGETWPALIAFLAAGRHALGRVCVVSDTEEGLVREAVTRVCEGGGRFRYEGRVHEQLVPIGEGDRRAPGLPGTHGDTGLVLRHSGYRKEALARKGTAARNLALLALELADRPGDAYVLYQIGRTQWQDRPAVALRHFERALATIPPDAPYLPALVREMGHTLRRLERPRDALALVRHYGARLPDFTDLVFLEGLVHMDLGDPRAMVAAFERCLALGAAQAHSTVDGVGTFRPHHNLGLFYELAGDVPRARRHYQAALCAEPRFGPAAERLRALDSTEARRGP